MVEVNDVRRFLKNIPTDLLSDDTIQVNIDTANTIVDNEASKKAAFQLKERAKLLYASWLSFLSYATEVERTLGTTPPTVTVQLETLKTLAEQFLVYVKRGDVSAPPTVVFDLTESLMDKLNG